MARRYAPLTKRQLEVLAWIDQGCPDGVWGDSTYKTTAYALAARGLVTVDRRRHAWMATLTNRGRYYLEHGAYPNNSREDQPPDPARKTIRKAASFSEGSLDGPGRGSTAVSPVDLIADLQASDGHLTVPSPTSARRAEYRSAISRAITDKLVPDGFALRHSGRDRGDLVIRLVGVDDLPPQRKPLEPIAIPESLDGAHAAVVRLRDDDRAPLQVSEGCRARALLIAQAIAAECVLRGHAFGLRADSRPTFQIDIGQDVFGFCLFEEYEPGEVVDSSDVAKARYDWQRVQPVVREVPTGRLVVRLGDGYGSKAWADRKRWRLVDKLPDMFAYIEAAAAAAAERRTKAEVARRDRRQAWEEAVPRAKQAYVDSLNRKRLAAQVADMAQAAATRSYADQLEQQAASCTDPEVADQIRAWAAWVRDEAERTDPLNHPARLAYVTPKAVAPGDYDEFMPKGMSGWHPPAE